jgi:hypothetical protein
VAGAAGAGDAGEPFAGKRLDGAGAAVGERLAPARLELRDGAEEGGEARAPGEVAHHRLGFGGRAEGAGGGPHEVAGGGVEVVGEMGLVLEGSR